MDPLAFAEQQGLVHLEDDDALDDMIFGALMPRSDSGMSTASTDMSMASTLRSQSAFVIEAFCTFHAALVHLDYPDAESGWAFRPDQGGYSCLRWDLGNDVCIVAKHSTCAKAMRPKAKPCRNCEKKQVWRRECIEATNTFFIFALTDAVAATKVLMPLVFRTVALCPEEQHMWMAFAPKINFKRCVASVGADRVKSMMCRERNLRLGILNGGLARVRYDCGSLDGDSLLRLLIDDEEEAGVESPASACTQSSQPTTSDGSWPVDDPAASQPLVLAHPPSECRSARSPPCPVDHAVPLQLPAPCGPLLATPVAVRRALSRDPASSSSNGESQEEHATVVASVVFSPTRHRNVLLGAYEDLLSEFVGGTSSASGPVTMPQEALDMLSFKLWKVRHNVAEVVGNELLRKYYSLIGSARTPQMLVKSTVLSLWVNLARSLGRTLDLRLGFVSMHSLAAFDEMCRLPLLPCQLTEREVHLHASYDLAASATLPGTHPILCAFYEPHAPARACFMHVLPIGF